MSILAKNPQPRHGQGGSHQTAITSEKIKRGTNQLLPCWDKTCAPPCCLAACVPSAVPPLVGLSAALTPAPQPRRPDGLLSNSTFPNVLREFSDRFQYSTLRDKVSSHSSRRRRSGDTRAAETDQGSAPTSPQYTVTVCHFDGDLQKQTKKMKSEWDRSQLVSRNLV